MDQAVVEHGGYVIYPLALHVPVADKWQAIVIISRTHGKKGNTLTNSKAFLGMPGLFEDEEEAREFALTYGRMLIEGANPDLPA